MKNIVIVAHKNLPQPDDDLVSFLNRNKSLRVMHIRHSFSEVQDRLSYYDLYFKGKEIKKKKSIDYRFLPEVLIYIKELFFTLWWIVSSGYKWDTYIAVDGLCAYFGLFLRALGKCREVVYWSIDFVPLNRFSDSWKNYIYRWVNSFVCKRADEVWDLSPRMAEGRKKYWGIELSDYKSRSLVPYGMWLKRIRPIPYHNCQKNTLVFMGHLMPKQGVDTVIKRIPEIIKEIPDFSFKIIGGGVYRENLERLAKDLGVEKHCLFLGKIPDNRDVEKEIAKSAVAIAPYLRLPDSYTYYADPGKVKTYLACGVPVLLTDLPWDAGEIEKENCGLIINDDGSDLVEKLLKMLKTSYNSEFRQNAMVYSKKFDYEGIFSNLGL